MNTLGAGIALLGLVVLVGWIAHWPQLIQLSPRLAGMPYSTAIGFASTGLGLIAAGMQARYQSNMDLVSARKRKLINALSLALPALAILLGALAIVGWYTHRSLGLVPDPRAVRQWFQDSNPYVGQMRPIAAMAFMAAGLATIWVSRQAGAQCRLIVHGVSLFTLFAGLLGIASEVVGFTPIFSRFTGPTFLAGGGFVLVSFGLLALIRSSPLRQTNPGPKDADLIGLISGAVVLVIGSIGLLGGFAVLYPQAEGELEGQLELSLANRTTLLRYAIQDAANESTVFATLPLRAELMRSLQMDPTNPQLRSGLQRFADGYRAAGFTGVAFRTRAGVVVARAGGFVSKPALAVKLDLPGRILLLWDGGYILHFQSPIVDHGIVVGSMEAERRLAVGGELHDLSRFGDTLDFAVCAPASPESMDCFPFRSTGNKVLRGLPTRYEGKPIPAAYALAGRTGIVHTRDYRGTEVIAAYQPIGSVGLGAVLKIDAEQLYDPIARRLYPLLLLLPILGVAAALLLRLQMLPLLRRLTESELRFRETLEHAPIGMLLGTSDGRILEVNDAICQMLGYSAGELKALALADISYPEDLHLSQNAIRQVIGGESDCYQLEKRYLRKDGQLMWVQATASLLPGVMGGARQFVIQIEDINERKALMETLRESEESFRTLADYTYDWEYWRGPDKGYIYLSPSCERITGYSAAEFVADPDLTERIVHPEDRQRMANHLSDYKDDQERSIDFRIVRKDGAVRWLAHVCRPIVGENGEFRGRRVSNRDITDRKVAEEELARAQERLTLALEASSLSIWTFDIPTGTVFLDSQWAKIVGGPPGETVTNSESLMQRMHPDDVPKITQAALNAINGGQPFFQEEFRCRTESGEWRWILCSGKINEWDANDQALNAIGTSRDITERKTAEEQIHHWAYFDRLTNLPNRRLLEDRLQQLIAQARRKPLQLSLLFIDLDKFKPINDDFGHEVGDWLLQSAALRMQGCLRESDTVARIGGDEFVALLPDTKGAIDAVTVAENIRRALEEPFIAPDGKVLSISSSIGVALFPDHADTPRELLRLGDEAMYRAKKAGRNTVEVSAPDAPSPI